jgi:hypothetical protein
MYQALFEAHRGLAILGCLTTVLWAAVALIPTLRHRPRLWKPLYSASMATIGLAGIAGMVLAWLGGWIAYVFPWLGFLAVWLHGAAGVRGRKALAAGAIGTLATALLVQVVTLIAIYGLMTVKPF